MRGAPLTTDSAAVRLRKPVLRAVCAFVLIFGLLSGTALAQSQWKMTTEYPENNISGIALVTFGKLLTSKTLGALTTVTAFDNEMKITSRDMPQAAQDHRIDGGDAFVAPLEGMAGQGFSGGCRDSGLGEQAVATAVLTRRTCHAAPETGGPA